MTDKKLAEQFAALDRQNAEFDALTALAEEWGRLQRVAVVDDDYPEARHKYEGKLKEFLEACRKNGRIRHDGTIGHRFP